MINWDRLRWSIAGALGAGIPPIDAKFEPPEPQTPGESGSDVSVDGLEAPFHRREIRQGEFVSVVAGRNPATIWIPAGQEIVIRTMQASIVVDIGQGIDHDDTVRNNRKFREMERQLAAWKRLVMRRRRERRGLDRPER